MLSCIERAELLFLYVIMNRQSINWYAEQPAVMPDIDRSATERWLCEVAAAHGFRIGVMNYIFCDDEKILEVNRQFINHDYYTDIITFDYSRGDVVSGDIYISLDTVATNASAYAPDYHRELFRVIAHGLLHLCGIDDKGPGEREIMERNEDEALAMLDK